MELKILCEPSSLSALVAKNKSKKGGSTFRQPLFGNVEPAPIDHTHAIKPTN